MDYFTRYVNMYPMKDQRATTVAQCISEDYIRHHGIPESIHTDQGRQFESDLIKELCALLKIEKTRTSPYHAQCDGMVERFNRTLKDQLAKYLSHTGGEWVQYLPQVELAYNSSAHCSTGLSPFFLAHGREPHLPLHLALNWGPSATSATPGTPAAYVKDVTSRLSLTLREAAQRSATAKLHQKQQYDKQVVFHPYEVGDYVLLDDPAQRMNNLAARWKGPFVILKRFDKGDSVGVTYEITDPKKSDSRKWVVHHNRLKAYKGRLSDESPRNTGPSEADGGGPVPVPNQSTLTALSGALPYRPTIPLNAAPQAHRPVPSTDTEGGSQVQFCSDPLPISVARPCPLEMPAVDVEFQPLGDADSTASPRQLPPPMTTRSGRQVRPPVRYGYDN
uniref:Integrase catalytic domain-containing protein n=1 Tax=Takifugu rubripes TaxID=31033 RepID=A0A3B5K0P4_TAKRU